MHSSDESDQTDRVAVFDRRLCLSQNCLQC